jgi:hypothetical protein
MEAMELLLARYSAAKLGTPPGWTGDSREQAIS